MKILERGIVLTLMSLVFLGSIGVSVFEHLCSIEGQETAYFSPNNDPCETTPDSKKTSCCHEKSELSEVTTRIQKTKCCTEKISFYKISTENADKILKLKFSPNHQKDFLFIPEIFPTVFEKNIAFYAPDYPPLSSGKKIIIAYQVFRI